MRYTNLSSARAFIKDKETHDIPEVIVREGYNERMKLAPICKAPKRKSRNAKKDRKKKLLYNYHKKEKKNDIINHKLPVVDGE